MNENISHKMLVIDDEWELRPRKEKLPKWIIKIPQNLGNTPDEQRTNPSNIYAITGRISS